MNALAVDKWLKTSLAIHGQQYAPDAEAVALVLAHVDVGITYVPMPNMAARPATSFELGMDGIALRHLLLSTGLEVILFHSHLDTPAYPSSGDRRWVIAGERHLIYSVRDDELRCFAFAPADPERVRDGLEVLEVEVRVLDLPNT